MDLDRDEKIKNLRPQLGLDIDDSSKEEVFQNEVLRPILKLQNSILLAIFLNHVDRKKINIETLTDLGRIELVQNFLSKDIACKSALQGCIVGLLTMEELSYYLGSRKKLNKRLVSMLKERLLSQKWL